MSVTLNPEQVAAEWAERVGGRMQDLGLPEEEIRDIVRVIRAFIRIGVEQLVADPMVSMPNGQDKNMLNNEQALQVIDLFLRGVNQTVKRLQPFQLPAAQRNDILEEVAWKLFNLAKMLMALRSDTTGIFPEILSSDKDLKTMMRQSTEEILKQELARFEN